MNSYPENTTVGVSVQFSDSTTGIPADPAIVTLRVVDPAGAPVLYGPALLTHSAVGAYSLKIIPPVPGVWKYRWEGRGGVTAANESQFEVRPSVFSVITPTATGISLGRAKCHGSSR